MFHPDDERGWCSYKRNPNADMIGPGSIETLAIFSPEQLNWSITGFSPQKGCFVGCLLYSPPRIGSRIGRAGCGIPVMIQSHGLAQQPLANFLILLPSI